MKPKEDPLKILINSSGFYTGFGVNHEDKQFKGILEITPVVGNRGVYVKYRAVGMKEQGPAKDIELYNRDMQLFNEEHTLIAYNNDNKLCLWTLNSNVPTVCVFKLRRFRRIPNVKSIIIFGFGSKEDSEHFREEIAIEIWDAGNIGYNYYWGEAGGHFLARSTVIMRKL
jgi:hypothetical protein